jgi:DNA-binding transcriptional LysR family regulator
MDYGQLAAFVVFAERLNFTHAARDLHISQPALHVQIKKLTEAVGRPLYRRAGRALTLTAEGRRLAAYGREVDQRGRQVLAEVRGEVAAGPVVLASGQGAFLYLLGGAIRRFLRHGGALRLATLPGPDAIEAVRDARAHLAVVATDAPPPDLDAARLCDVGQRVVLPATHRLARRRSIRPADLAGESIVTAPAGTPHRAMLTQLLRAAGIDWTVAVEAPGWELMLHFARLGLGVAVVNAFCPVPPGLVAIPLAGAPAITYHLLARPAPRGDATDSLRALICEASGRR